MSAERMVGTRRADGQDVARGATPRPRGAEADSARGGRRASGLRLRILALAGALVLAGASPALADDYDQERAGHPLRILAYVVHPVGVALDYLLLRPAHWLVSQEPLKTVFGHED